MCQENVPGGIGGFEGVESTACVERNLYVGSYDILGTLGGRHQTAPRSFSTGILMPDIKCLHPDAPKFLERYGCRPLDISDIAERIEQARRGRDWSGMTKWAAEVGPGWVNDVTTLVFEVPLDRLSGQASLEFTQEVSMLGPSLFEYLVLDRADHGIVRMQWK